MVSTRSKPRKQGEAGVVSIEFLGSFVMVVAAALIGLQLLVAGHTLTQANSAARNGARAETITPGTGTSAAYSAVSSSLRQDTHASCSYGSEAACTVQIRMPLLGVSWLESLPRPTVTRTAVMPRTEP